MITKLETIFGNTRIIGLAGNKNTGKTNNLVYLIKQQRKATPGLTICVFGFAPEVMNYLTQSLRCREISDIRHMNGKKNTLFVIDEFQKLHLNDRREKDRRDKIIDFIYHDNNLLLLSSPNIREFNSVIGGVIERWLLKSVAMDQCINGSQLKNIIKAYKGSRKVLDDLRVSVDELLLINDDEEKVFKCDYIEFADNKKENKSILSSTIKNVHNKVVEKKHKNVLANEEITIQIE